MIYKKITSKKEFKYNPIRTVKNKKLIFTQVYLICSYDLLLDECENVKINPRSFAKIFCKNLKSKNNILKNKIITNFILSPRLN